MLLTASLFIFACAPQPQYSVDQVLDNVRGAIGYSAFAEDTISYQFVGRYQSQGMDADFTFSFEPDGRYMLERFSELPTKSGWDGKVGWKVGINGAPARSQYADLERQNILPMLLASSWLEKDGAYEATVAKQDVGKGTVKLNLRS